MLRFDGGNPPPHAKLQAASNRDVHDNSKKTTLPVAREIAETYVLDAMKLPWYIDLLNITLGVEDLAEAKRRIVLLRDAFKVDGRRGEPCLRCRGTIERLVVGGRSSFYCPRCQRGPVRAT